MLKHNPKLKKLWNKAKKRMIGEDIQTLDMRHKSSKEFMEGFVNHVSKDIGDAAILENVEELLNIPPYPK